MGRSFLLAPIFCRVSGQQIRAIGNPLPAAIRQTEMTGEIGGITRLTIALAVDSAEKVGQKNFAQNGFDRSVNIGRNAECFRMS
jgi:hypothetical protein